MKRIFDSPSITDGSAGASALERILLPSRTSRLRDLKKWHAERQAGDPDTKPGVFTASPSLTRKRFNAHSPWNGNLSLD